LKGILKKLEKGLEKAIEAPFAKIFRSGVHPLEVGKRLIRVLEDGRLVGVNEEVLSPHRFQCILSRKDYERLAPYFAAVSGELEAMIIDYCREKDYLLPSRPVVYFSASDELEEGEFEVVAFGVGEAGTPSPSVTSAESVRVGPRMGERVDVGVLIVEEGPGQGTLCRLGPQRTTLGRLPDNDLVLEDPKVSRRHAVVERRPEGFVIRDLGSTNGTFVNGRRVAERLLAPGDVILLGDTRLRFDREGGLESPGKAIG
jgi:hypothetical protein